ncbi:hypothetical protein JW890_04520 [candidate division WOR-3 bacterium]|nr:hypothetical protein [candidate division WOR-3 bacterium]
MLILFLKKRYAAAVLLLMFSVLPVVSYGFVSIANGWSFFPNPLLLKGNFSGLSFKEFSKLFNRFVEQVFITPHLAVLVISALILYLFSKKLKASKNAIILPFFIGTTLFHLIFARVGWFFRYEAYLIVIGLLVVSVIAYEMFPESEKWWNNLSWAKKIFFIFSILLFYAPLVSRVYLGFATTQKATKNIYEQQYQMGLFIQKFYTGESVMLNDIGAVCFLADIKCVDVWGIANHDVMRLKRSESYYPHDFEMIAVEKGCKLGIIYEDWLRFYGELPSKWIKVGVWKIKDNVVAARDEVTFFAFDSLEAYKLRENLSVFRNKLPKDVEQVLY